MMPTDFDRTFAQSGFPALLAKFGEPITYLPAAGGRRQIQAIVERDPPAILDGTGNAVFPKVMIRVNNSDRSGIWSKTVNIGSDQIELPLRIGDKTLTRFSMMQLLSQDSGVTSLAIT